MPSRSARENDSRQTIVCTVRAVVYDSAFAVATFRRETADKVSRGQITLAERAISRALAAPVPARERMISTAKNLLRADQQSTCEHQSDSGKRETRDAHCSIAEDAARVVVARLNAVPCARHAKHARISTDRHRAARTARHSPRRVALPVRVVAKAVHGRVVRQHATALIQQAARIANRERQRNAPRVSITGGDVLKRQVRRRRELQQGCKATK